jgi:hypothetical protein
MHQASLLITVHIEGTRSIFWRIFLPNHTVFEKSGSTNGTKILSPFSKPFPFAKPEYLNLLLAFLQNYYEGDFRTSDWGIVNGSVEATTMNWEKYCNHWQEYVQPAGVDPYLESTSFRQTNRFATGFAGRVHLGA